MRLTKCLRGKQYEHVGRVAEEKAGIHCKVPPLLPTRIYTANRTVFHMINEFKPIIK